MLARGRGRRPETCAFTGQGPTKVVAADDSSETLGTSGSPDALHMYVNVMSLTCWWNGEKSGTTYTFVAIARCRSRKGDRGQEGNDGARCLHVHS